ncbi:zinc finger Ran-binding domain-containing protein 2-like [Vigna unguiculata]|uniref:RanBP2-type domain-containing protein n=1 Tax=Vigna unguiculata TaxID=3917 RepID=A0A4D6N8P2_VIGUN|nr:zinc finger Ran-binding domain-containing protein 2-like [Vigna unguiculata]XP_027929963.1 zinc finger Ran-binding domain-containing protein 2-like [Vigna unguiculata]QCE08909.1 hypothetical protein DEO72_LG10g127 [Vigna unguiculata]
MMRVGDWKCRSCQHLNFQRRECCQRCGDCKGGEGNGYGGFGTESDVRPGDWYCDASNCASHNFATRSTCFQCGASRNHSAAAHTSSSKPSWKPGWKHGDWICNRSGCNEHNFASRMECFKCCAPRDLH